MPTSQVNACKKGGALAHCIVFCKINAQKSISLTCPLQNALPVGIGTRSILKKYHASLTYSTLQGGEKGWDPSSVNLDYIVQCFRSKNTPVNLTQLLSRSNSRKETNHDNTKAIGGYKQAKVSGLFIWGFRGTD